MQVEYKDGSLGEPLFAETIEELLPAIKEALDNPDVKCVRLFKDGDQVKAQSKFRDLGDLLEEAHKEEKKRVTPQFPGRKRHATR